MYLSCLLVEDGIRHLFSYQSNSVSSLFSSYSLACVSVPSSTRHLRSWTRCPPRAPFLITPLLFLSILSWTTNTSRSRHLSYSVVTLDTCVRNFPRFTGCSLGEAIKCVAFNPARCLGIDSRKGTLRPGAEADLIFLIAAVMSSASGSGERRSRRKSKRFYAWL